MKKANPYQHPLETGKTVKATSVVIRTCEAEIEDSWMGKVTVVALSMADSLELGFVERILGNMTKTVSCAVFYLWNSVFDYGRHSLNEGNRGRHRAADEIWENDSEPY